MLSLSGIIVINASNHEKAEFFRYLVAGFSAVGTDLVTYWLCLGWIGPSPAKAASFLSACCVAYAMNKFYTFKAQSHSWIEISKFIGLYATTFLLNVAVNKGVIMLAPQLNPYLTPYAYQMGWLMATGVSTIVNYLGQKFWVFRKTNDSGPGSIDSQANG
ncbi:MAG TPA: GtrA family protein [Drouetiella sp.]